MPPSYNGQTMLRLSSQFLPLLGLLALACNAPPSAAPSDPPPAAAALKQAEPIAHADQHQHANAEEHSCGHEGSESCGHMPEPGEAPAAAAAAQGPAGALVRITDPANTCMLSNRYLGEKKNVPVTVGEKTYFGCCPNCAARIGGMAQAQTAVDPLTGHTVDKATAVLARDATNRVLYFENEESFAKMQRSLAN